MMKRLIAILLLILMISPVMGLSFNSWVAENDYWKSWNDTYVAIKYNASGNHTFVATGNATWIRSITVAGGGGGGGTTSSATGGGGGGAGGFIQNATAYSVVGIYTIAVGTGGAGSTGGTGTNGSFSTIQNGTFAITAIGGGGGGGYTGSSTAARAGGSGGGASGSATGASGVTGQGSAGGSNGASSSGGGGGGATGVGGVGNSTNAGNGGAGFTSYLFPTSTCYAGGGAGGVASGDTSGTASCGGGAANTAATFDTGGGGGGETNGGAGGTGSTGIVIIMYEIPAGTFPNASFTSNLTSAVTDQNIQFNDTSAYYPTAWNWSFGDGSAFNLTQNPIHSYSAMGTYPVCLNASNLYGFNTSCSNIAVINATVVTEEDIWLVGQYAQTFVVTDDDTAAPIGNCTVRLGSGQSNSTSTDGITLINSPLQSTSATFTAEGYNTEYIVYIFDDNATHYVELTKTSTAPYALPSIQYTPTEIRFKVVNYLGNPVAGATVSAVYNQTTFPDAEAYLESLYGVNSTIASMMLSNNLIMSGQTGSDGGIVFTMHPSIQYNITATSGSSTVTTWVYPKEQDYNVWLPAPSITPTYAQINATLTFTEPNASYFTMGANYEDLSGNTSSILFYVNKSDGTPVYQTTVASPGTSNITRNYTIANTRGQGYYWGVRGTRTGGNISLDQGVTGKGPSGVMLDLRLPDTTWYPWISLFILFLITSLSSKVNVRFMAILMPVMAAMFWWFGWMQGAYLASMIPFGCLLGAVYYMKGSLRENFGVGGPGSLLVNIVVFMIILQMMIGFVNGLGVFNQTSILTSSSQFSNVDLTDIQTDLQNFGGINDSLQSAAAWGTIGWTTVKIFLNMIGAIFVIGIYLIEMFPYVPAGFFAIIQGGIYLLYILFIVKLVGKSGPESDF